MKKNDKHCTHEQSAFFSSMSFQVFEHFWINENGNWRVIDQATAMRIAASEKPLNINPAPDCAELGLMLIAEDPIYYSFTSFDAHQGFWETTVDKFDESFEDQHETLYTGTGETEAESKAEAVNYMLKNNIHTIDHLNNILL